MTKAEAWDILAKVIEDRQDDNMEYAPMALTRIRGVYWGLKAKGIEDECEDDGK